MSRSADTAEIPVVERVTVAGGTPFAEKMNHELVTSRVQPSFGSRKLSKPFHLAGAASVVSLAATLSIGLPLTPSGKPPAEIAMAAVVETTQEETDVQDVADVSFDVTVDGETVRIDTDTAQTYAAAFAQAGIEIGARDEVSVSLSELVSEQPVTIVRVTTESVIEEFAAEHQTERIEDPNLPKGEEEVETAGVAGSGTRNYQVTYRDGEESSRVLLIETVAAEPVTEVIRVGTQEQAPAPSGAASGHGGGGQVAPPPAAPVPAGSSRQIAQGMLASYGWGMDQWSCLDALWQRESNWNHTAMNPSSGAYGIPQSLPGSKMASAGADWQTNPATQIRWGLGYIQGRYGSPCGAWGHSQARGWY
ncbi:aggregation-promoting factor C-terminal-like domain-containing protein [Trueperella bonasi]|uniref:aggregation-promoting factor C-terminal-like domain-containing protein n=1 Tax=Trueperella bonasi TaxID=312286 RepID=UPI0027D8F166|nr:G5 domain-containing protein [Trueperella bonasi]